MPRLPRKRARKPQEGHGPIVTPWNPPEKPKGRKLKPLASGQARRLLADLEWLLGRGMITQERYELDVDEIRERLKVRR